MEPSRFKTTLAKLVEPELAPLGYEINLDPPGFDEQGHVWFERTLDKGVCIIIYFQPYPLGLENFIRFAVNLTRNSFLCEERYGGKQHYGYYLFERLAPWLWIEDRYNPEWSSDYWWHFRNVEELESACQDAVEKLLQYGISFLEDLTSRSLKFAEL